jgi:diguanylate cyclase (GGDEF)-like protein/PAS domain S-box-containing protein
MTASRAEAREVAPRFARERLLDPFHFVAIPAIVALLLARHHGMTAPEADWKIVVAYLFSHVSATVFAARFSPGTARAKPVVFLVLVIGSSGALFYVLGWGALLVVALLPGAAVVVEEDGSRYGRPAIVVLVATVLVGQCALALGLVRSVLAVGMSHGIACVEVGIAACLVGLLARGQREKEAAQAREKATEERFRALVQHASDAILIVEDGGAVRYASPAVERLLGRAPDVLEQFDAGWIDPDHLDAFLELFRRLREQPGATESTDLPLQRPDGSSRWFEVHLTNLSDNPAVGGFVCNLRDIGERHSAHQQLAHDAQHDPLTHLPNRRFFLERLEHAWQHATPDQLLAVLFVDVDHFKQVNDRLGHAAGDEVLGAVARCLSTVVRPTDVVARYAGDEFTVLLTDLTRPDVAYEIAERVTTELARSCLVGGGAVSLSVSVGVATSLGDARTADELLQQADAAMYASKRNGRGCWSLAQAS